MDEERRNWPILVGVTAGVVGGIVAAFVLHSVFTQRSHDIADAEEIIDRCHDKIKEIESNLKTLKQPTTA